MKNHRPLLLVILDGWGHSDNTEANAIAAAYKPNWDQLWQHSPHALISGSGQCVGLPDGQMGNSEVGHLTMGAGRTVYQDLTRIDHAIAEGDFFENAILKQAFAKAKQTNRAVHVMGLLSPGGVHSHENHIHALVKMAAKEKIPQVYLHAFLDGRDTPPRSALSSLQKLDIVCNVAGNARIASIIGRYYAMDRDKRWDRIEEAYDLLVDGNPDYHASSAEIALEMAYTRNENDEFVKATSIHAANEKPATIQPGDIVIFMNFRADRARAITEAFIDPNFIGFKRKHWPALGEFIGLSEYDARFNIPTIFPSESLTHLFTDCVSEHGLTQLRIAETEKYAHVTFFFNGGIEKPYPGEDRVLIPSPKVATYDLQPEMSAPELTNQLVNCIENQSYDVIICNFANADMVGHTGNMSATIKAIETIDACLGKIVTALDKVGGELLITADHGNAEQLFDPETNQAHTAHTSHLVPFIYRGRTANIAKDKGKLSDIAPTMLYLLGVSLPPEMTGSTLLKLV